MSVDGLTEMSLKTLSERLRPPVPSGAANGMREHANWLIEVGNSLVQLGQMELRAADVLEGGFTPGADPSDLSAPNGVSREYISAMDAAFTALEGGPLDLKELFSSVVAMGARCSNERSLSAMLVQNADRFATVGGGKWVQRRKPAGNGTRHMEPVRVRERTRSPGANETDLQERDEQTEEASP